MADSFHHSLSSVKQWGGEVDDYRRIHEWFDESKKHYVDFRHRALRHHTEGITLCVELFGPEITVLSGKRIPVRWIAEQHVIEDLGFVPTVKDWLENLQVTEWMMRPRKLSKELDE